MTSLLTGPPALAVDRPVRDALADLGSAAPGIAPFGLLIGVTATTTGIGGLPAGLGAALVFGGSAQLAAFTALHLGSGLAAAVASGAVVNARLMLYGAALEERFRDQPRWFRLLGPVCFLQDQTYLAAAARPVVAPAVFRRYWLALGGGLLACWTASVLLGLLAAPWLPPVPHLGLVAVALFVTMLVTRVAGRTAVLAAGVAALATLLTLAVAPALAILVGTLAGVAVPLLTGRADR